MTELEQRRPDVDDDPEPNVGVAAARLEQPTFPPLDGCPAATVYRYESEAGELLFAVGRYELEDGKTFRQARLVDGRWQWNLDGARRVLYRLPALLEHIDRNAREPIYVVEGEKDVHAVEAVGGVATCNPMGAGKWADAYAEQLQGARRVIVVADRDEPGRRHAAQVVESLAGVGIVAELAEASEGKDASNHLAAGHSLEQLDPLELQPETVAAPHVIRQPQLVPLAAFVEQREEQAQALLGDETDTFLARGGLGITGGVGGSTKTTLMIDAVAHLAAGIPWLRIPVPRPLRIALIENEGSRAKFRDKLRQKVESWEGPAFAGNVLVLDEPWTAFSFADRDHRRALRDQCVDAGVELVVANPLGNLGVDGVGSPEETEAFMRHLRDCGLDRDLAFWLIHHFNRGGHRDILHKLSGAWDRHADTIIGVERENTRRTKLTWAKTRWATPPEDKTTILEWHVPTRGFTLVETEHPEQVADTDYEQRILDHLRDHPWATTDDLHEQVEGRVSELRKARHRLETAGRVTRAPSHTVGHPGRANRWNLAPEAAYNPVPLPGTGQDGEDPPPVTSDEPRPPVPPPVGGRDEGTDGVPEQAATHDEDEIERIADIAREGAE